MDADRWGIYLLTDGKGFESFGLEVIAMRVRGREDGPTIAPGAMPCCTKTRNSQQATQLAAGGMGLIRKKEREITWSQFH